jgi:hypothetical protein
MAASNSDDSHRHDNLSYRCVIKEFHWGEGAFRWVHRGQYTAGPRRGQHCVCKEFKSGSVFEDSYFANDLAVTEKTSDIVGRFNRTKNVRILVNIPQVWRSNDNDDDSDGEESERCLIEPYIRGFRKFNSNTGWHDSVGYWPRMMQALSHFSYHATGGAFVLCDLQGGMSQHYALLSDPVLLSRDRRFGPTDLGPAGIINFFAKHVCNEHCEPHWSRPRETAKYYECTAGTLMELH